MATTGQVDSINAICEHLAGVTYEDLPPEVIDITKRLIVETAAVTVAGREAPGIREFIGTLEFWGGTPDSSVMLDGQRLPASEAVLANVALASARGLGNSHATTGVQPLAPTFWSAAALAEMRKGVSGKKFVTAVVLGSDLMVRLALATPASQGLGHHPAVYSGFGAAAVVGKLNAFKPEMLRNSLGIMLSQASATMQAAHDSVQVSDLQSAFNASDGFQSARMAELGVVGVRRVIDGEFGLARMFAQGNADHSALVGQLGAHYYLRDLTRVPEDIVRANCTADFMSLIDGIEQLADVGCIFEVLRNSTTPRQQ